MDTHTTVIATVFQDEVTTSATATALMGVDPLAWLTCVREGAWPDALAWSSLCGDLWRWFTSRIGPETECRIDRLDGEVFALRDACSHGAPTLTKCVPDRLATLQTNLCFRNGMGDVVFHVLDELLFEAPLLRLPPPALQASGFTLRTMPSLQAWL